MVKLYFKKLILLLCTFLMWLAISVTLATVLGLADDVDVNYTAYSICMISSGVITAVLAGVVKARDNLSKIDYLTETELKKRPFGREVAGILKSKPFIAEVLGFATWLVPLMVYVCTFPENATLPLYQKALTSLLVVVVLTIVFALLDLAVTFTVRKIWMRKF